MPSTTTEIERFTQSTAQPRSKHDIDGRGRGGPEEDQEEEALSLCDLPLLTHKHQQHNQTTELLKSTSRTAANSSTKGDIDFDFDFGSLTTSLEELEAEMCSADEVFYRGQILPFRHSVSSDSASSSAIMMTRCPSQPMSRSGSGSGLQRTSTSSYTSSSRSSSTNSSGSYSNGLQGNNTSNNSASLINHSHSIIPTPRRGTKTTSDQEADDKNTTSSRFNSYFHSFPSPKPQIRTTGSTVVPPRPSFSSSNTPSSKKSAPLWEIFRLGLVRAPEIDLEGWKNRQAAKIGNSNNNIRSTGSLERVAVYSRNSSSNSGGSSSSCDIDNGQSMQNHFTIGNYMSGKRSSGVNGCYKYDRLRPSGDNNNNSKGRRGLGDDVKQRRKKREGRSTSSDGGGSSLFNFANYGSCRCSVGVIEPESVGTTTGPAAYTSYSSSSRRRRDVISVTRDEGEESGEERKKNPSSTLKKREVVVVSRHRTFEWLRDISSVGVLNTSQ